MKDTPLPVQTDRMRFSSGLASGGRTLTMHQTILCVPISDTPLSIYIGLNLPHSSINFFPKGVLRSVQAAVS